MSHEVSRFVTNPSIYVLGKTEFDDVGFRGWIEMRGLDTSEYFLSSPVKALVDDATRMGPNQDRAEMMAELAGRFCYDSMLKGRPSDEYLANVVEMRHGSVLEHVTYNLAIEGVSRSLAMELIRHRAGFAISQESQRFVDASLIRMVVPPILLHLWEGNLECTEAKVWLRQQLGKIEEYKEWQYYIADSLEALAHTAVSEKGQTMFKKRANEAARASLPNCAETRLVWTGNLRSLRHFCALRGDIHADLEIRRLAAGLTELMLDRAPFSFYDFSTFDIEGGYGVPVVACEHEKV